MFLISNKHACFWAFLGMLLLFGRPKFISIFIALFFFIIINFYQFIAILSILYVVSRVFFKKLKKPDIHIYSTLD